MFIEFHNNCINTEQIINFYLKDKNLKHFIVINFKNGLVFEIPLNCNFKEEAVELLNLLINKINKSGTL